MLFGSSQSDDIIEDSITNSPLARRKIQVPNVFLTTKLHRMSSKDSQSSVDPKSSTSDDDQFVHIDLSPFQDLPDKENIPVTQKGKGIKFYGITSTKKHDKNLEDELKEVRSSRTDEVMYKTHQLERLPQIRIRPNSRRIYTPYTDKPEDSTTTRASVPPVSLIDMENTLSQSRRERGHLVQFVSQSSLIDSTDPSDHSNTEDTEMVQPVVETYSLLQEPEFQPFVFEDDDNEPYQNLKRKIETSADFTETKIIISDKNRGSTKPPNKVQRVHSKTTETDSYTTVILRRRRSVDYEEISEVYESDDYQDLLPKPEDVIEINTDDDFVVVKTGPGKNNPSFLCDYVCIKDLLGELDHTLRQHYHTLLLRNK